MEGHGDLMKWLWKMGYDGEIPNSLSSIHYNSTSFIWEQLMQNARPRQEVQHIRDNIIIHRLKSKPINKQDEFSYPIKEIDLYQKKIALESKVKSLHTTIKDKETTYANTLQSVKMKTIAIEKLNEKIKSNQEREFLLRRKIKITESNIQSAENTLKSFGNITPVELEGKPNTEEIRQTLEKCAGILEKQFRAATLGALKKFQKRENGLQQTRSVEKSVLRDRSVYEQYLSATEKNAPVRTSSSAQEPVKAGKENLSPHQNVTRRLFDRSDGTPKKRESLGLLSDSIMSSPGPEDFLMAVDASTTMLPMVKEYSVGVQETFLSMKNNSNALVSSKPTSRSENNDLKKLCENEEVGKILMELLHCHNRPLIWNVFQSLDLSMHTDILQNLVQDHKKTGGEINQTDIAHLQFLHVHTEFKILKLKAMLKQLEHQEETKKRNIRDSMSNEKSIEVFELLCKEANLDATLTAMKKELAAAKTSQEKKIDLLITSGRLDKLKENIGIKSSSVRRNISLIREVFALINRTRSETVASVHNLATFIDDMSWASPLVEGLFSDEIRTFQKFPLEYNRRTIHVDPSVYYKDLCTSNLPLDQDVDDQTLYILSEALENPLSFPEVVVFNILRAKYKLDVLKSMRRLPEVSQPKKYSFEDLQAQESYVQYALDQLTSLLHSPSTKRTLASGSAAKKVMEIWLEMPLKDFISSDIKVDGNTYSFYEKQYDKFYKDL